jgi:hypothetical protein
MLGALYRSLNGWSQWINNPDIITYFNKDELKEINNKLSEFTHSFISYDLDITQKGVTKGLIAKKKGKKERKLVEEIYI